MKQSSNQSKPSAGKIKETMMLMLMPCIIYLSNPNHTSAFQSPYRSTTNRVTKIRSKQHTRKMLLHEQDEKLNNIDDDTDVSINDSNLKVNKKFVSPSALSASPAAAFGSPVSKSNESFNRAAISFIKNNLFDSLYTGDDRCYARFYVLETIARMPYFAYLSVLHLYETFGWWRRASYLKIHFAESWNELHHLMIMEEMGGNDRWADRFLAQHVSFFYYWFVVAAYLVNPTLAYNLNEAVEEHAFSTYDEFIGENEEALRMQPAPKVAREYYGGGDLYMLDAMQTLEGCDEVRERMPCETLLDTFIAIREDEREHVKTMKYLQRIDADVDKEEECEVDLDNLIRRP